MKRESAVPAMKLPLRPTLARLATLAALVALAGSALAQDEPSLLSPASHTPKVSKAAAADRVVVRQRPVEVNAAPLADKAKRGGTPFRVELFDGATVTIDTMHVESRGDGNYTYFGKVRGQPRSEAVLTFVDGHLAAEIVVDPAGGHFRIQAQPGTGHWLQEIDARAFPPDHPGDAPEALPPVRREKLMQGEATATDLALDTAGTIDLLVVYSDSTATAAGTTIGSQIQAAVDRANLAYANSGIATRLRLVHHERAGYAESGNFSTDLSRLQGTADGYMDGVHTLRTAKGADLVSLFVENGSACGIGYINSAATSAFTVVSRGCATSNLTLAHEIGHNFGARHDTYVDANTSPYAYGHGYVNVAGSWRTVLAYNDACAAAGKNCTRVAHFSNPGVAYNGAATGTSATADNARLHNERAYTVANFRAAVTSGCSYALSPTSASVASAGASGSTTVSASTGCAWNASSNAAWLTVGAGSGTSGSGTLNYVAAANSGPARSGAISIGGVPFTVSQASGCTYTVSPTSATATAAGGSTSLSVTGGTGCTWTASSSASWITIGSGASGSGNGTVTYNVATNTGAQRTANLTVAGRTVTVTQAAAATPTPTVVIAASLSPGTMDFGNVNVGRTSSVAGATFTNTGNANIAISSITLGGLHPADFVPRNGCLVGMTLTPGQSCSLGYAFAPKAKGPRSATATVGSDAGTRTLNLTGNGKQTGKG